jgi:hypothetical protein
LSFSDGSATPMDLVYSHSSSDMMSPHLSRQLSFSEAATPRGLPSAIPYMPDSSGPMAHSMAAPGRPHKPHPEPRFYVRPIPFQLSHNPEMQGRHTPALLASQPHTPTGQGIILRHNYA